MVQGAEDAAMPMPMPMPGMMAEEGEAGDAPGTIVGPVTPRSPGAQIPAFAAGGGVDGLGIRLNMLAEGLERTQEFVGNAAYEAEEMIQAICERLGMLHCRLERIEVLTGLGSPPTSPRGEGPEGGMSMDGADSPQNRCSSEPDEEAAAAAAAADAGFARSAGMSEEMPFRGMPFGAMDPEMGDEEEMPRSPRMGAGSFRRKRSGGKQPFPAEGSADEDGSHFPGRPVQEPASPASQSGAKGPTTGGDGARRGAKAAPRPSSASTVPDDNTATTYNTASELASSDEVEEKWWSSSPQPFEMIESLMARVASMEMELRGMHGKEGGGVPGAGQAGWQEQQEGMPLSSADAVKVETSRAIAAVEGNLREYLRVQGELAAEALRAECTGRALQAHGELRGDLNSLQSEAAEQLKSEVGAMQEKLSEDLKGEVKAMQAQATEELKADLGKLQAKIGADLQTEIGTLNSRLSSLVEAVDTHGEGLSELRSRVQRGPESDGSAERCSALKARLEKFREETSTEVQTLSVSVKSTSDEVQSLSSTVKSLKATTESALAKMQQTPATPPTPRRVDSCGDLGDGAVDLGALGQRLALLEGELSRGRVRASRSSSVAPRGSGEEVSSPSGGGAVASSAPAFAVEGLSSGLTAVAKVLGLVRDSDVLGVGEWDWRHGVGRRLEHSWAVRAQELDPRGPRSGASTPLPPRSLCDIVKAIAANQTPALPASNAGGGGMHDKREAARLHAWMTSPGRASSGSVGSTAPPTTQPSSPSPVGFGHQGEELYRPEAAFAGGAAAAARPPAMNRPPRPGSVTPAPGVAPIGAANFPSRRSCSTSGLEQAVREAAAAGREAATASPHRLRGR
eukprot:TRINITY_DN91169_c0_g1_i1.p1 TRINITY_DN91169_c0_g1~~TRINITY_DN91169_c0_g1_i1.p1  ORF type:complete len:853 (-),score=224.17 TRINITY_DN91169_c0_g1_i1:92-2650(-)